MKDYGIDFAKYVADLQADGWKTEARNISMPIEKAFKAEKDGFNILGGDGIGIAAWGSDKLQIPIPNIYPGINALKAELRHCPHCDKHDVDTHRYSFAGRACKECLPALKEKHEFAGWTN